MRQKKPANRDLPPRMIRRTRKRKNGDTWVGYYYNGRDDEGNRLEIPLGGDLDEAKIEWARLDRKAIPKPAHLMGRLFDDYESKVIPGLMSGTQKDYLKGLKQLRNAFESAPSRWQFSFDDGSTQKAVRTKYQDKKTGELVNLSLDNDEAPVGLPPVHTDRHIYPNKSAAEQAAKARLVAFNRSTADVRLEMPGRTDLFAERQIMATGFKVGLDGDYLVDSVEQIYTQSGWSTTIECNAGKKGKAKAAGKKVKKSTEVKVLEL